MKFRKKPVVIEAFQMTKDMWDTNDSRWPQWAKEAWDKNPSEEAIWTEGGKIYCGTREGPYGIVQYKITWNDWIVQDIKGEIYPIKPDIFEATYKPVNEEKP